MSSEKKMMVVVITTYNNPKSLELCLLSLSNQTYENFEVYIADDGSRDETRDLILRLKREMPYLIYHIWQPDVGYRKSKINNTVFRQLSPAKSPILVCLDHDVIVHRRFLEDHYLAHERVQFKPLLFMGRRVDLSPELSKEITPTNVMKFNSGALGGLTWPVFKSGLKGHTKNVMRSVRLDSPAWLTHLLKRDRVWDLLGSNYSISLQVMLNVNGYNEDYQSYWGEDGDLFVRVRNSGVQISGKIGYAVQWHLFHKRLEETPEHIEMYRKLLEDHSYVRCQNGIEKK